MNPIPAIPTAADPVALIEQLRLQASIRPDTVAHTVHGRQNLSYGAWERASNAMARGLWDRGVSQGTTIVLLFDHARWTDFAVAYMAVQKLGAVAVPLSPHVFEQDLCRVFDVCRPSGIVCPADHVPAYDSAWTAEPGELAMGRSTAALGAGRRPEKPRHILYDPAVLAAPKQVTGPPPLGDHLDHLAPGSSLLQTFPIGTAAAQQCLELSVHNGVRVVVVPTFRPDLVRRAAGLEGVQALATDSVLARTLVPGRRVGGPDADALECVVIASQGRQPGPGRDLGRGLERVFANAKVAFVEPTSGTGPVVEDRARRPPGDGRAMVRLTPAQEGILWREQLSPACFTMRPLVERYVGPLDVEALGQAMHEIARRHDMLRATFRLAGDHAVQLAGSLAFPGMQLVDLAALSQVDQVAAIRRAVAVAAGDRFDLVRDSPFQPSLLRLSPTEHLLVIRLHHIVWDDQSWAIFARELAELYRGFSRRKPVTLPSLPLHYSQYALWQRRTEAGREGIRAFSYWDKRLAGGPLSCQLPVGDPELPRGARQPIPDALSLDLGNDLSHRLKDIAAELGATTFMVLFAGFCVLLRQYTGRADVLCDSLAFNRRRPEFRDLIGCFADLVTLRVDLSADPSFPDLLTQVRGLTLGALANQGPDYEAILRSALGRDAARHGVKPAPMVVFQQVGGRPRLSLDGLTSPQGEAGAGYRRNRLDGVEPSSRATDTIWGDGLYLGTFLLISVDDSEGSFRFTAAGMFDRSAVERLLQHFEVLLGSVAHRPHARVSEHTCVSTDQRVALLGRGRGVVAEQPASRGLASALLGPALDLPQQVAVACGADQVTFTELRDRVDEQSASLREQGLEQGALVGLGFSPSIATVVTVLAIWDVGAAFVGLRPGSGGDERACSSQRMGAQFLLGDGPGPTVLAPLAGGGDPAARPDRSSPLACIVLTDDTTGETGVEISQRSLLQLATALCALVDTTGEVEPAQAGTGLCLTRGQAWQGFLRQLVRLGHARSLRLVPGSAAEQDDATLALLRSGDVDVVDCTGPDVVRLLGAGLEDALQDRDAAVAHAATFLVSGLTRCPAISRGRTCHLYGPPEAGLGAAVAEPHEESIASLGRPLANVRTYVLCARREPVPLGVVGDVYIGGPGLASGCRGSPTMGESSGFVTNDLPGEPGRLLWKSGQRGFHLPDGRLHVLGDADDFVDFRGFGISLRRIERALLTCPGIRDAVVRTEGDPCPSIAAYLVADGEHSLTMRSVRDHLARVHPGYVQPCQAFLVDHIGGAGRGVALPGTGSHDERRDAEVLSALWAGEVGRESVDIQESYWQVFSFLRAANRAVQLGIPVTPQALMRGRTVEQLANAITGFGATASDTEA